MLHAPYRWIGDESLTELWHARRAHNLVVSDTCRTLLIAVDKVTRRVNNGGCENLDLSHAVLR